MTTNIADHFIRNCRIVNNKETIIFFCDIRWQHSWYHESSLPVPQQSYDDVDGCHTHGYSLNYKSFLSGQNGQIFNETLTIAHLNPTKFTWVVCPSWPLPCILVLGLIYGYKICMYIEVMDTWPNISFFFEKIMYAAIYFRIELYLLQRKSLGQLQNCKWKLHNHWKMVIGRQNVNF